MARAGTAMALLLALLAPLTSPAATKTHKASYHATPQAATNAASPDTFPRQVITAQTIVQTTRAPALKAAGKPMSGVAATMTGRSAGAPASNAAAGGKVSE